MSFGCGGIVAPMERPSVPRMGASRAQAHQSRGCTGTELPIENLTWPEHSSLPVKGVAQVLTMLSCNGPASSTSIATCSGDCSYSGPAASVTFWELLKTLLWPHHQHCCQAAWRAYAPFTSCKCRCGDSTQPGIGVPAAAASGLICANTLAPVRSHLQMLKQLKM